jgi:hypothetical protein
VKTAADIARLVRDPETSFQHAVELIQLFADREAHRAVVGAVERSAQNTMQVMDAIFGWVPA